MNLYARIALLGGGGVIITAMAFAFVASKQTDSYVALAQKQADAQFSTGLSNVVTGVYSLVSTEANAESQKLSKGLTIAANLISSQGNIRLSKHRSEWRVVNQDSGKCKSLMLPDLLVGGRTIASRSTQRGQTPVVDEVQNLVGLYSTIFVRSDSTGDMVRVATNLPNREGRRAVGSYMPRILANGSTNPVIACVESGKTFNGRYMLFDEWYLTAYRPIYGGNSKLIGMLFVGLKLDDATQRIRKSVIDTKIGDTGYAYVLGASGSDFGRYIISQQGKRDGEFVWDVQDSAGNYTIRQIISKAIRLKDNEVGHIAYKWRNPGESELRMKVAKLMYYKPWDWIIGASAYEDEYRTYNDVLRTGRNRTVQSFIIAGLLISAILVAASLYLSWNIVIPIKKVEKAVQDIAAGAYDVNLDEYGKDELGSLADSVRIMAKRLSESLKALTESETRYRSLFDNSLEGVYITTVNGKITSANPALAEILGYGTPENLINSISDIPAQIYNNPEDRHAIIEQLRHDNVVRKEAQLVRKDGTVIWGFLSLRALEVVDGRVVTLQGSVVDISERKSNEQQLTDNARRFRVLSEIDKAILGNEEILPMIDAILEVVVKALEVNWVRTDFIKGAGLSRCVYQGPAASLCENCQCSRFTIDGEQRSQLDTCEYLKYQVSSLKLTPERVLCERAGSQAVLYVFPVSIAKELVGTLTIGSSKDLNDNDWMLALSKDIADHLAIAYSQATMMADIRHQAESLEETVKQRTMQLEASNKELESFCYSVSHDLRAPLRVIDGYSNIVMEELGDKLDDESRAYLERMRNSADRMGGLIDSLLELSRISRLQLKLSPVDMSSLAKEIVADLELDDRTRSVEWNIEEGIQCLGDHTLIRVLLENILGNSWKYTSKKRKAKIAFGVKPVDGESVYFVKDNGAGFDMQYASKMFGAFQRMHRDTEFPGTGIGLATVERIISKHGGRIWAESKPDKGATFFFTINATKN